jgi:hypothetical protein
VRGRTSFGMVWTWISDPGSGPSFLRLGLQGITRFVFLEPALLWLSSFSIEGVVCYPCRGDGDRAK